MFDKLIESDTEGAEFKNRSRYFTVSTLVVGTLFLTAVVYSLYAAEVGLGAVNFDVSELVAPLETVEPKTEPEPERPQQQASQDNSQLTRQHIIPPTTNSTLIPKGVSVVKSPYQTLDPNRFLEVKIGPRDTTPTGLPSGVGRGPGSGSKSGDGMHDNGDEESDKSNLPPPVLKEKAPAIVRTSRVLNGEALYLPKPAYPRTATILNLESSVKVQVTIDEKGNVVSAKAIEGHSLFRSAAEQSARGAKFKPTYLNDAVVKVTGLITYNFKKPN